MKPRTIGIVVSHGFHVRNIVYSRLYSALTESFQVVLILPIGIRVPVEDQWLLKGAIVKYVEIKKHPILYPISSIANSIFVRSPFVASLWRSIAESSEELIFEINSYLFDRKRDLDGRLSVISSHLGLLDGNAWVRIFNHIKNKVDCKL